MYGTASRSHSTGDYVADALRAIPEPLRMPLVMRHMTGASDREIAETLLIPRISVAWRIEQGYALLNIHLSAAGVPYTGMNELVDRTLTLPPTDEIVARVMSTVRDLPVHGATPVGYVVVEALACALAAHALTSGAACGVERILAALHGP